MLLKSIKVVKKLQMTASPTDVLSVLEMIRKIIVCERLSYDEILERCLHTEDITSRIDPIYPILKKDLAALLENKSKNEQIMILTKMIMMF